MHAPERMLAWQVIEAISGADPDSEVWVVDPDERPTPVSAVFRSLEDEGRVYVVARPWLVVPAREEGA